MKKLGFTLAEVLITLTIIGVIAALTIPNLMKKHMQKEMEVAFNKSVALLNQGLSLMANEEGAGLKQAYATYNPETQTYSSNDMFFKNFPNYIKIEKQIFGRELYNKINNGTGYKTFNKSTVLAQSHNLARKDSVDSIYISPGGLTFRLQIYSSQINIFVDTNGNKGPNRAGYDYFWLVVSDKDRITYNPYESYNICNENDNSDSNGLGCAKYALVNKCPDDDSKTYWECLR